MKNLIYLIIVISFLLTACENGNKVEIVADLDELYLLPDNVDSKIEVLGDDEKQLEEIMGILSSNYTSESEAFYFFKSILYINELGDLEKIKFSKVEPYKDFGDSEINPNFESLIKPLTQYLSSVKFKPATFNGKAVSSQFFWEASVRVDSTGKSELYIGSLDFKGLNYTLNFNRDDYVVKVEEMPSPIGGIKAIQEKIIYPEIAKRAGIEGRVYIRAFIDENGNVANVEIIKGLDAGCSEAAAEAVKNTKFEPGRQKGTPEKVQVTIPILFKLDYKK